MPIYLINQMDFLHSTSNNTMCEYTFMCPSKLFSSPISSWLWRPRHQALTSLDLTTACCTWMFHTQMSRSCSGVPHACLPRDREALLCKSVFPATNVPTKKAAGCNFTSPPCSCLHRNFHYLHLLHRILWCSFLLLQARTATWWIIKCHLMNCHPVK